MTTDRLVYSIDETAKLLGISRNLCYRLAREKSLPGAIHLGPKRMMFAARVINRLLSGEGGEGNE